MFHFFRKLLRRNSTLDFPHDDLTTIAMFAAGHTELRDEAVEVHHRLLHDRPDLRYHAAQAYMAQIDAISTD